MGRIGKKYRKAKEGVAAKPSAAPMKGAVQGLAATTASTPQANASTDGRSARQPARRWGISDANSKLPIRFSPIAKNSSASTNTTAGS